MIHNLYHLFINTSIHQISLYNNIHHYLQNVPAKTLSFIYNPIILDLHLHLHIYN
jgi:hypothetical protein